MTEAWNHFLPDSGGLCAKKWGVLLVNSILNSEQLGAVNFAIVLSDAGDGGFLPVEQLLLS